MRGAPILLALAVALAATACARQRQTYYVIDPQTGQPVPVVSQQPQPQFAQSEYGYARQPYVQVQYAPQYAQPQYAPPSYQPPPQATPPGNRGLFNSRRAPAYTQPYAQPVPQYGAPQYAQPSGPYAYAPSQQPYTLDSGDKLRIVVFGQDGITNSYLVDAGGNVNLPLIGAVPARGYTSQQLSQAITARLKQGYVRDPSVSVEVDTYRPFFILGEVTTPGQYPYVANMTAETAVAIAGGFSPRADKRSVQLSRTIPGQQMRGTVPLGTPLRPGDTIVVKERWF